MTMPSYSIFPIEPPASPSQLAAYKTLRLTSLQIDPQAFGSDYAREVAFTEDVWRERLDSRFRQTLVASVLPPDAVRAGTERDADSVEIGETGEWIGTASILGPSGIHPSALAPFKEAAVGANWEIYALYAMWVHPAHRGKGVGARLVKACMEWALKDVVELSGEDSRDFEKVVVLLVHEDNFAGRALYSRVGFTYLEGIPAREGERWMSVKV